MLTILLAVHLLANLKLKIIKSLIQMKNSILLIAAIVFALFLTGCQQDDLMSEMADLETTNANTEKAEPNLDMSEVVAMDSIDLQAAESELEERSGRTRIFEETYTIHHSGWLKLYMNKHQMNPDCKYIAVVSTYQGDPDLYIKGAQHQLNSHSSPSHLRTIRYSAHWGQYNEESYVYAHDLEHHENYAYFSIYAGHYSRFKVTIYKECDYYGQGPDISFHNPQHGAYYHRGTDLYVKVNAHDYDGVEYVKLYVNGQYVRKESYAPYEWGKPHTYNDHILNNMHPGTYKLRAVAKDKRGYTSEKTITIHVRH